MGSSPNESAMALQDAMRILLWLLIFFISFQIVLRLVRRIYKFPIPHFLTNLIDNPIRRRIQPPESTPIRHGIYAGMRVLEVGPGNGTYTLATGLAVGEAGRVAAIDIEPRIIERLWQRVELEGAGNHLRAITEEKSSAQNLEQALGAAGLRDVRIQETAPTLEDVFLSLAGN